MEHRVINGGKTWLPFARSRVKALRATGLPNASQSFVMPDGAQVRVSVSPGDDFIRLDGGALTGYQFFTTGPERLTTSTTPAHYRGYSLRAGLSDDVLKAKAYASSVQADSQDPQRWTFLEGARALEFGIHFPIKGSWQVQAANHHTFYPLDSSGTSSSGVAGYPLLRSSWSSSSPLCSLGDKGGVRSIVTSDFDVQYDIAPALVQSGMSKPVGGGTAPDADWYRRAALRRVTNPLHPEFGSRLFVVMSDISNNFHAFPVKDSDESLWQGAESAWPGQNIKTNIKPTNTKSAAAPLPAWCRKPVGPSRRFSADHNPLIEHIPGLLQHVPQYRWAFNSACTRACSVVLEVIPGIPCDPPNAAHTPRRWVARYTDDAKEVDIEESLPGLAEISIALELTGPDLNDFSFSLALQTDLRPSAQNLFVMAADYAWTIPVAGEAPGPAQRDDLMLMLGEIYHTSDQRATPATEPGRTGPGPFRDLHACKALAVIRNHTQGKTVRTFLTSGTDFLYQTRWAGEEIGYTHFPSDSAYRATGSILAYELRTLSFVLQKRLVKFTPDSKNAYANIRDRVLFYRFDGGPSKAVMQLEVYHANALVETKVLDPDSPLNAELVSAFTDTSTAGLFKYPVNDIGQRTASPTKNVYDRLMLTSFADGDSSIYGARSYAESRYAGEDSVQGFIGSASFNAGAYFYSAIMAPALRVSDRAAFTTHPDGRWSVVTLPSFYYAGESVHEQKETDFNLSLMRQGCIDIINLPFFNPLTKLLENKRFTHLEAFNKAFEQSLAPADYLYTFSTEQRVEMNPATFVENLNTYLVVQSKTQAARGRFLISAKANDPVATRRFPLLEQPSEIDAFTCEFSDDNLPAEHWLLRGASLFY